MSNFLNTCRAQRLSIIPQYRQYSHDDEDVWLPQIRVLIGRDLSEPYSVYVYRYFLNQWPHLCWMVCPPPRPLDPLLKL